MGYRGRLAPTPSGYLHLGHAQTFWTAYQRAKEAGGQLIFRHDDLDRARCRPEFVEAAEVDLAWLGMSWDLGPYFQSQRQELYQECWEKLKREGWIYACSCSRKEIQRAQQAPHQGEEEPIYPGTCRQRPGSGEVRSWRFRVPPGQVVSFVDGLQGPQSFVAGQDFGDFVVWKPGEGASYQLACAVDDGLMEVSEVVRGADLLLSSARQILLFQALDLAIPDFYHCPLRLDESGRRLAKRHDALALRELKARGMSPQEILSSFAER